MSNRNAPSEISTVADPPAPKVPAPPRILSVTFSSDPDPSDLLPTLLTQTLIIPESKTAEGILIASIADPWRKIRKLITEDPSLIYQMDPPNGRN